MSFEAEHRRRNSLRLEGFDYRTAGAYFVTICAHERQLIFERASVIDILWRLWLDIASHFPNAQTDEFVVMPNHVHGIVWLTREDVGAQHAAPSRVVQPGSVSAIVRSFKSAATRELRLKGLWDARPMWQRSFYDHVVRDDDELNRIRGYIQLNPENWHFDHENPTPAQSSDYDRAWSWLEDHEP